MFWAFKLSIVVDILAFLAWRHFRLLLEKLGEFFSNLLVTLKATTLEQGDQIDKEKIRPFFEK
jgi:hypothetical protein